MSVLNTMQTCIEMISTQNKNPLFKRIREGFPQKKSLLEKQLALLHQKDYDEQKCIL